MFEDWVTCIGRFKKMLSDKASMAADAWWFCRCYKAWEEAYAPLEFFC